jgi:hypothetical protein
LWNQASVAQKYKENPKTKGSKFLDFFIKPKPYILYTKKKIWNPRFCLEARIDQHWSKPVLCSSLIFQRTIISFGYLKEIKNQRIVNIGYFKKNRIKELASSRYFENNIIKEPLVMGI